MEGMKDRTEGTEKATAPTKMNEATASSTYMGDSTTVESHTESSTTHASASRRSNREASTKRRVGREELDILEREFKRNPRPTTSQKQDLAEFIGVDPRQLNVCLDHPKYASTNNVLRIGSKIDERWTYGEKSRQLMKQGTRQVTKLKEKPLKLLYLLAIGIHRFQSISVPCVVIRISSSPRK